jgi:hypothetical protein
LRVRRAPIDKAAYYRGIPMVPYDLVKEFAIAMVAMLVVVLVLSAVLSSPDVPSATIQAWAKSDPVDFVTTAATELAGQSTTAQYGPPYNDGSGSIQGLRHLGDFSLTERQTDTAPLFIVAEVHRGGQPADRTFYFVNYEARKDALFQVPTTTLSLKVGSDEAVIRNTGQRPAVGAAVVLGVSAYTMHRIWVGAWLGAILTLWSALVLWAMRAAVLRPGHLASFSAGDNYFWLDPGESNAIRVSDTDGLAVDAWNLDGRTW